MAEFRAEMMQQLNSLREEKEAMRSLMARREASVESAVSTASASASLELARVKSELNAEREEVINSNNREVKLQKRFGKPEKRGVHYINMNNDSTSASSRDSAKSLGEKRSRKPLRQATRERESRLA